MNAADPTLDSANGEGIYPTAPSGSIKHLLVAHAQAHRSTAVEASGLDRHLIARLLGADLKCLRQLGVMGCPAGGYEVIENGRIRPLRQVLVGRVPASSCTRERLVQPLFAPAFND